jgi:hypothetical protein
MALYNSRNPSDPLENPTNCKIQRKSLIYKGFEFYDFLAPSNSSKFDLFIHTVHATFQQIHIGATHIVQVWTAWAWATLNPISLAS